MILKATLFFIFLTVTSSLVSAQEISFDSPETVRINEPFEVSIEINSEETFDVKIFVHNSDDNSISRGEYISEIFNDDWKDSWNYINEAYPEKKDFELRVTESPGERGICVRVRKTGAETTKLSCKEIEVLEAEPEDVEEESEENNPEPAVESPPEKISSTPNETLPVPQEIKSQNIQPLEKESEVIFLNEPSISPQKTITTKKAKSRNFLVYSLLFFLALLTILMALRKL